MKKIFLIIIALFFFKVFFAQDQAIRLTNIHTSKEKIIKEHKRVTLKTSDGRKIKGILLIENSQTVFIDTVKVELTDIDELKRNPPLTSILTSGFLIYGGAVTVGFGVLIGVLIDSAGFWLLIPAAGMIYTGIKPPNFHKNHKTDKGWRFEIVDI